MSQGRLSVLERDVETTQKKGAQVFSLKKAALYRDLRQSASAAHGIEAIATLAIESGEATEETLESIAAIAGRLREDIKNAALAIAELSDPR